MTSSRHSLCVFFGGKPPKELPWMHKTVCLLNFISRHEHCVTMLGDLSSLDLIMDAHNTILEHADFLVDEESCNDQYELKDDDDNFSDISSISCTTFTDISCTTLTEISSVSSTIFTDCPRKSPSTLLRKARSFGKRVRKLFCCI